MSGGLVPSKSTVYVSNLPFSLTNNDLHKIFEKHGKVVKVTILKDKQERRSRGVAFILFLEREAAHNCVRAVNNTEMFGRTLKCSIAKDNGRTTEFIRRKEYKDKSRCYECGDEGHLSFNCPQNLLGDREPPPKKKKRKYEDDENPDDDSEEESTTEDPRVDSLSAAIQYNYEEQVVGDSIGLGLQSTSGTYEDNEPKRKIYKKDAYFSDEEELD